MVPLEGVGQHTPTRGKGPYVSQRDARGLRQCRWPLGEERQEQKVRQVQRTLYRKAKQDKGVKVYRRYDKLWREDGLWEA